MLALLIAIGSLVPASLAAQGLQTGIMSGVVKDPEGLPLPGATVTVTSPALQGSRTAVTDAIGAYIIRGLPPGTYEVLVQFTGTTDLKQTVEVPLGGIAELDATLKLGGIQETVNVVADSTPPTLATTQQSANYRSELISTLPIGRRPFEIAELAPGVTDNTPNVGQLAVGGAFAFDSIFLIDGVDTNDNLFGNSNNLFVEDAIEETQVLTSGISAEYGRFGGGVVNVITRSGGNQFHGSFRTNFSRPSWSDETPFEDARVPFVPRTSVLSKNYEGTIGGPIIRSRLWFFNADRYQDAQTDNIFAEFSGPYTTGTLNKRFELKLTGSPIVNHTVSGSYLNSPTESTNLATINTTMSMTASTLVDRQTPNSLWVMNYNGVLSNKVFATFQWSKKDFGFRNAGGTSTAIADSPFITRGALPGGSPLNRHFNAPYFDSNDPEDRNNKQYTGSVSYFLTSRGTGRHDLKTGFEHFTSSRNGGNSQSSTGYVFRTDYLVGADGKPIAGSDGEPIPIWGGNAAAPGSATTRLENWIPTRGATLDIRTLSLYLQDRWQAGNRITMDLGVRYEQVRSEATGDIVGADTDTVVPRLGVSFDIEGNGRTIAQATYARYSGRFSERAFGRNTNVGTPSSVILGYTGPNGQGLDFAPAFNLANYTPLQGSFPTANVFFDENLTSPKSNEFTLSLGRELGNGGYAKAIYSWRNTSDFIEDLRTDPTAAGKTTVIVDGRNYGTFDNIVWANTSDQTREYQALQFLSRVRFTQKLFVEGHWTVQIKNHGNFEGEAANQPGNGSVWFDYPEVNSSPARYYPYGPLDEFQRHKVRIWTSYNQGLGRFGSVDIAPIWRINSGLTYSLAATSVPPSAIQAAANPGYVSGSTLTNTLFFDERGSESFKGYGLLDLSVRYGVPIWQTVQPWIQMQVYNVLNNNKLIQWDTTVTRDLTGPVDAIGQPINYVKGPNFGKGTAATHYPRWSSGENGGRTFRLAMGVRF
jgi:outer membrane receptor protein involved in Fe transport